MTSTTISGNDSSALQNLLRDRLQEKIKSSFIELIPEQLFNGMLDAATDEFLNGPRSKRFKTDHQYLSADDARNPTGKSGYVSFEKPTVDEKYNVYADTNTLPGMVYAEIVAMAKAKITELVAGDERFQQHWDCNTSNTVVPIIDKIVGDNAQAFMRAMMSQVVGWSVSQAINQMRSGNNMNSYVPPPPGF
jgi:hypothetical protein